MQCYHYPTQQGFWNSFDFCVGAKARYHTVYHGPVSLLGVEAEIWGPGSAPVPANAGAQYATVEPTKCLPAGSGDNDNLSVIFNYTTTVKDSAFNLPPACSGASVVESFEALAAVVPMIAPRTRL
mmetsp:Transcript_108781/g.264466  ORF Transcript_108781/g.264466 Transcript_108781/m.264466 type:complete len:125 (+) Transcript_108781:425-799(+)